MTKKLKGHLTEIEQKFHDQAEDEVVKGAIHPEVWNLLLEKHDGNTLKAKEEYPQMRMEQMCKKLNDMVMKEHEKTKIRLQKELDELEEEMAEKDCIFDQELNNEWVLYTPERKAHYFPSFEKLKNYFYKHF